MDPGKIEEVLSGVLARLKATGEYQFLKKGMDEAIQAGLDDLAIAFELAMVEMVQEASAPFVSVSVFNKEI